MTYLSLAVCSCVCVPFEVFSCNNFAQIVARKKALNKMKNLCKLAPLLTRWFMDS